jgi:hypothetical protein
MALVGMGRRINERYIYDLYEIAEYYCSIR